MVAGPPPFTEEKFPWEIKEAGKDPQSQAEKKRKSEPSSADNRGQ
jgi:hypothetical protein